MSTVAALLSQLGVLTNCVVEDDGLPEPGVELRDAVLEPEDGPACSPGGDQFYPHPLQGLQLVEGEFPFLDRHLSPAGHLYAIMEGGHAADDGAYSDLGSGVVELERRELTAEERIAIDSRTPPPDEEYVHSKIGPRLRAELDTAVLDNQSELRIPVMLSLRRPLDGTVTLRINRAIAEGRIGTYAERHAVRAEIIADLASEGAAVAAPLLGILAQHDIVPEHVGTVIPSIHAAMPASLILELSEHADVKRIDAPGRTATGGANGQEKADGLQTRLNWSESYTCGFLECNYDGEDGAESTIHVAVLDPFEFRDEHVAFRESSSATLERIAEMWDCNDACGSESDGAWTPPEDDHGTAVLGALIGDYRDAQDSGVTDPDDREERSAAAGEAIAYLYTADMPDLSKVVDHVALQDPQPAFLLSSMGDPGLAPDFGDCNGDTTYDEEVDALFEAGVGYFSLAGNDVDNPSAEQESYDDDGISGSSTNCTLWDPASAIGAFTVAAFNQLGGSPCEMRGSGIHSESSWGGATSNIFEGRGRTIVDIAGPWQSDSVADWSSNTAVGNYVGTSLANPTVGSAAIAFLDMMHNLRSSVAVDDPGMLYAWMLNMGDRTIGVSSYLTSGYQNRFGAGRLALRYIGNAGMNAPYWWYHYELCIDHNEVATLSINGGTALSGAADSLRATAWWYDRRFSTGTALDNINLELLETDDTSLEESIHAADNKERVFYNDVGGLAVKLEVTGHNVTSDGEGCGTNSMRVWVTILIEDDARNEATGPEWDATDCVGVDVL